MTKKQMYFTFEESKKKISKTFMHKQSLQEYDGYTYIRYSPNLVKKHFIALQGNDIYCYNDQQRQKMRFMHSLSGCHVVGCNGEKMPYSQISNDESQQQSSVMPGTEIINEEVYYMLTIKLSEKFKRIFYFLEKEERDLWYLRIKKSTDEKPEVTDKYLFGPKVGEGSFGKVFSA